jgi:hypothetical protein
MKPESDKRLTEGQKMRKHAKSIMKNAKKAEGASAAIHTETKSPPPISRAS